MVDRKDAKNLQEKIFVDYSVSIRRDFVDKFLAMCRWALRKENDIASKVPERESNSSYTAQADPLPSALSTRPMLLP